MKIKILENVHQVFVSLTKGAAGFVRKFDVPPTGIIDLSCMDDVVKSGYQKVEVQKPHDQFPMYAGNNVKWQTA